MVALHFLARQRPPEAPFPTARFVPARAVRAPSRSARPEDLILLMVRVLAVLLVGAAFAQPVVRPQRIPMVRMVVLDVSSSARSATAARDSAQRYLREGDLLIVFDSAARLVGGSSRDSLGLASGSGAPGSLSAALVAASLAAATLRGRADSVELVLVSAFAVEEWDAATERIRSLWRGRARLVRLAAPAPESAARDGAIDVRSPADDPIRAAAALMGELAVSGEVRIDRAAPENADSTWARAPGRVLVRWPAAVASGWPRRERIDTVGAVVAGDAVLVSDFVREAVPPAGRVIARWVDGAPAATERAVEEGCVRDVAIPFPVRGDVALGESARRLLRSLAQPCGGARSFTALPDSLMALLRGGDQQPRAQPLALPESNGSLASRWLLIGAMLALLAEMLLRRRSGERPAEEGRAP